jgi:hypothetical protein
VVGGGDGAEYLSYTENQSTIVLPTGEVEAMGIKVEKFGGGA